jgi:hypothetical protein
MSDTSLFQGASMLSFSPVNLLPQQTKRELRILRSMSHRLLVGSIARDNTSIHLIRDAAPPILVLSLRNSVDILNASISEDNELVHITERVHHSITHAIGYRSAIYDVQGISRTDERFYSTPIDGSFVANSNQYHLVVYTDQTIINFAVSRESKKVLRKKQGTIRNVIWVNFGPTNLSAVVGSTRTFSYQVLQHNLKYSWVLITDVKLCVLDKARLPCELCLMPIGDSRFPIFRYSRYRFFFFRLRHKLFLIQQLFDRDANMALNISLNPGTFTQTVVVPNVPADIPVCFLQIGDLALGFAPNYFICFIHLNPKRPLVILLPKCFASSCCGLCAETIPEWHSVVDIDSGDVYKVGVHFKCPEIFARFIDTDALTGLALVSQRSYHAEFIADLFHILQKNDNVLWLLHFTTQFFSYLPQPVHNSLRRRVRVRVPEFVLEIIEDMETEFPSASGRSRLDFFRDHLAMQKRVDEAAATKVLRMLKDQNNTALVLRNALSDWIERFAPHPFWQAAVKLALHTEAIGVDCPRVPALVQETQATDGVPVSCALRHQLRDCGLFQERTQMEDKDLEYWRERIGHVDLAAYGCDIGSKIRIIASMPLIPRTRMTRLSRFASSSALVVDDV